MKVFLGNRLLGETQKYSLLWPNIFENQSDVYLCQTCGEVWGRVMRGRGDLWFAVHSPCVKHPREDRPGGTFLTNYLELRFVEEQIMREMPGLADWEFQVHLAWAEKFLVPEKQGELV